MTQLRLSQAVQEQFAKQAKLLQGLAVHQGLGGGGGSWVLARSCETHLLVAMVHIVLAIAAAGVHGVDGGFGEDCNDDSGEVLVVLRVGGGARLTGNFFFRT